MKEIEIEPIGYLVEVLRVNGFSRYLRRGWRKSENRTTSCIHNAKMWKTATGARKSAGAFWTVGKPFEPMIVPVYSDPILHGEAALKVL